ncbi:MAG: polyphosphate kinase 2 [Pseudomonadota bacterium]
MSLPFDGAISRYFETDFPAGLREAVKTSDGPVLGEGYPYTRRKKRKRYADEAASLQIELVKLQAWAVETGARIAVIFEGRDAAGKGGSIKRFMQNLNPRGARVAALPKPTDREQSQWYFQRYAGHLPAAGEIVFFDRSWYNRAVVEHVFGFCTSEQRQLFFEQVGGFEAMLAQDGIHLFKFWLTITRAEQMRRMRDRERDPLKHWKLSPIDIKSLSRWDAYTAAIEEMFQRTHTSAAPWVVVRADDKRRARLATQRVVLSALPYTHRALLRSPDPSISGSPEAILHLPNAK